MDKTNTYVIKFTDCKGSDVICERKFYTWDMREALIKFYFEFGEHALASPFDDEYVLFNKAIDEMTETEMVDFFNMISKYYHIVEIQYVTVEQCYP
jgi:hypothetical protein